MNKIFFGVVYAMIFILSGCSLAPGLYVENLPQAHEQNGRQFQLIPITAETLRTLSPLNVRKLPELPAQPPYEYHVGAYDVLQITVWDHPELESSALFPLPEKEFATARTSGHYVDSEGNIVFPHVGTQQVAGKTVSEIRQLLIPLLARFVPNPQLAVRVAAYRSKRVHILGEVTQPGGVFLVDTPLRVLDAIAHVGGLTHQADAARAVLLRGEQAIPLDLTQMLHEGKLAQNYLLQDKDVIQVPNNREQRIFLLGEVKQPSSQILPWRGYTLGDALSQAQGLDLNTADSGRIFVFRQQDGDVPIVYHLNARSVDALLLATRFSLRPLDVIYVAPTSLTRWNRVVQQILPSVKTLWYPVSTIRELDALHE